MRFQSANCVSLNLQTVSTKTYPVAVCVKLKMNVLVEIGSLKKRKLVKPNRPKNQFLKSCQTARLCQTVKISQAARTQISKNLSKRETLKNQPELSKLKNCQEPKMFQVATEILAIT